MLNRLVVGELSRDPDRVLMIARDNIARWRDIHAGRLSILAALDRWSEILDEGVESIVATLTGQSEEAEDLRQNSPFAGVLSDEQREQALASFRSHWEAGSDLPRSSHRGKLSPSDPTPHQEVTMTSNPHADPPAEWASDKIDLDDLLKGVKPYSGGDELAIPDFFETDQEHAEFVAWYRAVRATASHGPFRMDDGGSVRPQAASSASCRADSHRSPVDALQVVDAARRLGSGRGSRARTRGFLSMVLSRTGALKTDT